MNDITTEQYIKNIMIKSSMLLKSTDNIDYVLEELRELTDECNSMKDYLYRCNRTKIKEITYQSMTDWQKDVFDIVDSFPNTYFTLEQVYKFENILHKLHPKNNHVTDKIRQVLQQLRDQGLIEFEGNGEYIRLWK